MSEYFTISSMFNTQVGDGNIDHASWISCELLESMGMARPVSYVYPTCPGMGLSVTSFNMCANVYITSISFVS